MERGEIRKRDSKFLWNYEENVDRWIGRGSHVGREYYRDKPRKPRQGKITVEVEDSILALRNTFGWGTARIRKGLYSLPAYAKEARSSLFRG